VLWKAWGGGGFWESSVRTCCLWTEASIQEFHKAVETFTFCRQGTCRCYSEFTNYHPIIIVLGHGAYKVLYKCLSSFTVLECHRWWSCFRWWASSISEGARTIHLLKCILQWWGHSTGGMSHHKGPRWAPQTEGLVQISDQINMADMPSYNDRLCGQSSWLQIRRSRVRFPGSTRKKKVVGPLSLVSRTEELLRKNTSGSGLKIREYGVWDVTQSMWHPLAAKKLALSSLADWGLGSVFWSSYIAVGSEYLIWN
jgi:hypothetical protein